MDALPATTSRVYMTYMCAILFAVSTLFVFARFATRIRHRERIGWDDFFVFMSWIGQIFAIVFIELAFSPRGGAGRHLLWNLTHGWLPTYFLWIVFNFVQFSLTMAKCSIIWLYHRLSITDGQRRATTWLLVVVLFQGLSAMIVEICACVPISLEWTRGPSGPGCIDIFVFSIYNVVWSILLDLVLALAPIWVLRQLTMSRNKKIYVGAMFGLGLVNIAAASWQYSSVLQQLVVQITDPTYNIALSFISCSLEVCLATVFVCIPPLAPYFTRALKKCGFLTRKSTKDASTGERPLTIGQGGARKVHNDDSLFRDTHMTQGSLNDEQPDTIQEEWQDESTTNASAEPVSASSTSNLQHYNNSEKV